MILRAPAIVCPQKEYGWRRPLPTGYNYRGNDGKGSIINGIVEHLPAGCDINPFPATLGQYDAVGSMLIGRYVAPSYCAIGFKLGPSRYSKIETDCQLKDEAGNQLMRIGRGFENFQGWLFRALGTVMQVELVNGTGGNPTTDTYEVTSMRGCVARIDRYEEGPDGIVTVGMSNQGATPVVANRVSDDSEQILSEGQIYLPPGKRKVSVNAGYANGGSSTAMIYEIIFEFEIPYGL